MMTGMAAQEGGPREHVPQVAQLPCVPVPVNDEAPALCHLAAYQGCIWCVC